MGRGALRKAIDEFYRQAEVYNNARTQAAKQAKADQTEVKTVSPYPVHGIKADVGLGKSEISMANIAIMISAMRAAKDKRTIVIADPCSQTWRSAGATPRQDTFCLRGSWIRRY